MNRQTTLSPSQRDAGLRRLRLLTIASAVAGGAAAASFGALAAVSYPGHQSTSQAVQQVDAAVGTSTGTTSSSGSSQSSGSLQSSNQVPTISTGRAQTTTGGS